MKKKALSPGGIRTHNPQHTRLEFYQLGYNTEAQLADRSRDPRMVRGEGFSLSGRGVSPQDN